MRARSRRDRWQEEVLITSHEMVWIVLWFQTRSELWKQRAQSEDMPAELAPYAYRQASIWEKLKHLAAVRFHTVHKDFSMTFGYGNIN